MAVPPSGSSPPSGVTVTRDYSIASRVRKQLLENPRTSAKWLCKDIGLDYVRSGHYVRNVRSKTLRELRLARVLRGHPRASHRVEYVGGQKRSPTQVELLRAKAASTTGTAKGHGRWYVASNRNRMLCWSDNKVSITISSKTGLLRVLVRRPDVRYSDVEGLVGTALIFWESEAK